MSLGINTNLASLNAQRNLSTSQSSLQTSLQRLSSGLRVNSAKDDAAGLAISERMNAQIRGNTVAIRNANDAVSLTQTADGALGKIGDNLQRMRELAVQARNDTNNTTDKTSLDNEYQELAKEVQRIAGGTKFNGISIIGSGATTMNFQVGAGTASQDTISVVMTNMTTDSTITAVAGDSSGSSIPSITGNASAIATVIGNLDTALDTINSQRSKMGATQNRFDSVISNLKISVENQTAARGRIIDADFATETANMTRSQILQQAGTAMLAQANQLPNSVLSLLR